MPLDQLKVGAPPSYLSDRARAEVRGLHMAPGDFSAFEPRLVPTLAYALDRLPWVERVESLELRYPAQIAFRLVLHKPAALSSHAADASPVQPLHKGNANRCRFASHK